MKTNPEHARYVRTVRKQGEQNQKHLSRRNKFHCSLIIIILLQAPSAETVESKGSPGFFSQVFSELTAPFNEVDEQEFLSEDSDSENPSLDDQTGDDDDPEDKNDETSNDEGDKPDFATLPFAKSVTEDVNSARTADQQLPVEGDSESGANQELGQVDNQEVY